MALRVTVDHAFCVGNAQCVGLAPGVFRHNENRQSEVIDPRRSEELILKAASYCPTGAIESPTPRPARSSSPAEALRDWPAAAWGQILQSRTAAMQSDGTRPD